MRSLSSCVFSTCSRKADLSHGLADELVPPEYVLVQLDVVPDLPEVVQKAEASGANVEKTKAEGCEKDSCTHEHKH